MIANEDDDGGNFILLPMDAHNAQQEEVYLLRQENAELKQHKAELKQHVERLTAVVDELIERPRRCVWRGYCA